MHLYTFGVHAFYNNASKTTSKNTVQQHQEQKSITEIFFI